MQYVNKTKTRRNKRTNIADKSYYTTYFYSF